MKLQTLAYFLLCLTILIFPLYIIRFSVPLGTFHLPSTVLEIVFGLTFIVTFASFAQKKFPWKSLRTPLNWPILLFVIASLVASATSVDRIGGLGILKAYFLEPVLFFYCFIFLYREKKSFLPIYAFLTSVFLLCLLSLFEKLTGIDSFAPHEIIQGRVTAVYNSANSLALFIIPAVFLSLALFLKIKGRLKYLFLFLIFFISLIVIWTKSRGGLVGEVIGLAVFGYGMYSSRLKLLKKYWYSVPILLVLLSSIFFVQMYRTYHNIDAYLYSNVNTNDTLEVRYLIWTGTINLLSQHPIFGAGLNGFKTLYATHYRLDPTLEELQYPHNIFLNFWVELGILGLIAFAFLCYRVFVVLLKIVYPKNPIFAVALTSIFVYWIIHGLVDVPYFKNDLSMEFWLMIGLTIVASYSKLA